MPTELSDLDRPRRLPAGSVELDRDARLFATRRGLISHLRRRCTVLHLIPDQLFHPKPPCDFVIRRGNLRVSEILDNGREITRAVLQAGAVCRVRPESAGTIGEKASSELYNLEGIVLMALGGTDIWQAPAGALDED